MFKKLEKVKHFKPKEREYEFVLYSFESKADFSSQKVLKGQSIVFISECYEEDGEYRHRIYYAACTNDLIKVGAACNWSTLSEKNVNCLGVLLIEIDMVETDLIADLLDDDCFSAVGEIPTVNSEELHFLQGNEDFFEKVTAGNKMQVVKWRILSKLTPSFHS